MCFELLNITNDVLVYGKVIIAEIKLPFEKKSIKPLQGNVGVAGGAKYITQVRMFSNF